MSGELRALLNQAAIAAEDLFAPPLAPPLTRPGPIRDTAMAQKIAQRRAEVLRHTPRNPFTGEGAHMPGYDMRPWWQKAEYPMPYVMTSVGMPDYPHWTDTVAERIAQEKVGVHVKHSLPSFEGWETQKAKKVEVAVKRILDNNWYSPHEHKLTNDQMRHMHSLREHFSMNRHKVKTPVIGTNTMPTQEWHCNMNALTVLSKDTGVGAMFRRKADKVRRDRARQRGEPSPPPMPIPFNKVAPPIMEKNTAGQTQMMTKRGVVRPIPPATLAAVEPTESAKKVAEIQKRLGIDPNQKRAAPIAQDDNIAQFKAQLAREDAEKEATRAKTHFMELESSSLPLPTVGRAALTALTFARPTRPV